ncbi:MAG: tryptophan-rich sensory protein [Candidatus Nanopelagicaceae bacterium]|nr:tryptophan-rich sensory protein [Candidatus Nanopelagicaceae bacterium]
MKTLTAATGIALVFVYVIGSGLWVNTRDNWYGSLNAPPWQPPDFIFGIIWPYNFIVLGIAVVTIAQRASTKATLIYLGFFALSVIFALTWAFQFYRPHNLQAASIALALTALLTIPMVIITFRTSIPIGLALLPYQAWVAIAANLSYTYSKLN